MKKLLLSIVFVVVTVAMLVAQTPQMTYQAVIRDVNGQLLTNRSVSATVKVKVGGSELFTQTYNETTNVHGLLTVTFGDAGFATIDWANASISCEVYNGTDVYIAENFQPVTAVPLAIKAITESDPQFNASVASDITAADTLYWNNKLDAEVDGSVTNELQILSISKDTIYLSNGGFVKLPAVIDSTSLDDAYNNGYEIIAHDNPVTINGTGGFLATGTYGSEGTIPINGAGTRMMWYPQRAAFRAGYIFGDQWDDYNVGPFSTAMGYNTTASGAFSTAVGYATSAIGAYSNAMGESNTAIRDHSTAMGKGTIANGLISISMGESTNAKSYASVVLGKYNIVAGNPTEWISTDPLFVIGNGTDASHPSNALTVYKNGNMDVNGIVTATGGNSTNWNTAFGWGNHASAGYLTTEVDPSVPIGTTPGEMQYWNGTAWVTVAAGKNGQVLKFKNGTPIWTDGNINDLEIGDSYGGGIITYFLQPGDPGYDTNVRHGIIAAPSDQSTGAKWGCWGTMISATSVLILTGAANTNAIVAGCSETGAAKLCDDLSLNTYTDWYLPSLYELELMFTNLHTQGLGDFDEGTYYWSSSENGYYNAWSFKFSNEEYCPDKDNLFRVRAVRSF